MKTILFLLLVFMADTALAGELIIAGETYPPYNYFKDETITGIDVEIVKTIFNELGVRYRIRVLPWARCWKYLKEGKVDVGLTVSKKQDRHKYVYYPETQVWDASFVFMTNKTTKATYNIDRLDDVKKYNLRIGVTRGNSYHEMFWKAFPWQDADKKVYHPQIEDVASFEQNMKKLNLNRVNVIPIVKTIGLYTARQLGLENITYYDFVIFSKPYYTVFSKRSNYKSEKFNDIIALMHAFDKQLVKFKKTRTFQSILEKYEK